MNVRIEFPHEEMRPGQAAAVQWLRDLKDDRSGLIKAPTGSGKTSIASMIKDVVAIVKTKDLQRQYADEPYNFDLLMGKNNYPCLLDQKKRVDDPSHKVYNVDDCGYAEKGNMSACEIYGSCHYIKALQTAKASDKAVLNYSLWAFFGQTWEAGRLLLDEAHELSDLVIEWAGTTLNNKTCKKWGLPRAPVIRNKLTLKEKLAGLSVESEYHQNIKKCQDYLAECRDILVTREYDYEGKERKDLQRLLMKITLTLEAMTFSDTAWYVRSGPGATGSGFGIVIRPLTARHHFAKYFGKNPVMMTATTGNVKSFSRELGLTNMDLHEVPWQYAASQRPVFDMKGPRMGQKTSDADKRRQGAIIGDALNGVGTCIERDWHSIIHCASYSHAWDLAEMLRDQTDRSVFVPNRELGKDLQIEEWHRKMDMHEGAVLVAPNLHSGYDGTRERVSIVAKVPYPYLGDDFEQARRKYDGSMFNQRAAYSLEQALGRVRREDKDYEPDATYVGIADDQYRWVDDYLTPEVREAIVR